MTKSCFIFLNIKNFNGTCSVICYKFDVRYLFFIEHVLILLKKKNKTYYKK